MTTTQGTVKAAGSGPGQRRLNGAQTSGRTYRDLSEAEYHIARTNSITIPTRDGTLLRADVFLPTTGAPRTTTSTDGSVTTDAGTRTAPALVSFSAYPRQMQDLLVPMGFVEAGASDFFVPRGYAHVIVNARGTGGSDGTYGFFDHPGGVTVTAGHRGGIPAAVPAARSVVISPDGGTQLTPS